MSVCIQCQSFLTFRAFFTIKPYICRKFDMIEGLKHAHSGLRWLVLVFLVIGIVQFFSARKKGTFTEGNRKAALFGLIFCHLQLVIGFVLYFSGKYYALLADGGMKNAFSRFYGMEHMVTMIIGIGLITFGYSSAKRMSSPIKKSSRLSWTYLVGLLIILAGIPWPFREALNGGWF